MGVRGIYIMSLCERLMGGKELKFMKCFLSVILIPATVQVKETHKSPSCDLCPGL